MPVFSTNCSREGCLYGGHPTQLQMGRGGSLMVEESRREVDLSEPYCLQPGGSATIDVC